MTSFQLILLAMDGVGKLTELIVGMINKAKQDHELTPDEEAVIYTKQHEILANAAHWRIEPDPS